MDITVRGGAADGARVEALVVGVYEGDKRPTGEAARVDRASGGAISKVIQRGDLSGKPGQTAVLYPTRGKAERILVVGLGKANDLTADRVRQAAGRAVRQARGLGVKNLVSTLHGLGQNGLGIAPIAQAIAEGSVLGNYSFDRYHTQDKERRKQVRALTLLATSRDDVSEARDAVRRGRIVAEAACLARDLASHPGQDMTPTDLARAARNVAAGSDRVRATVLGPAEIKRERMGALLGVARGSVEPPRFIVLDYKPKGAVRKTVCLVGKGITFDSGGVSLKPAENMEKMKYDMSGGAAVLGALQAVGALEPEGIRVIGLVSAAENMPGGRALKPGDILTASNGMTIEVNNTDAEGRLVLSDALTYARRFEPDAVVDLATLTGAVVIALGSQASGIMGNDQELIDSLIESGERTGERLWQLPLWPEYSDLIKSEVADMKNSAGREAGTIAGAVFLSKFASGYKWAHLDIAGTAWNDRDKPYAPKGSVGVGVRLLVDFVERMAAPGQSAHPAPLADEKQPRGQARRKRPAARRRSTT